jgi:hypothetical protein
VADGIGGSEVPDFPRFESLLRVLPIVRSLETDEGTLTIASMELYDGGSILRYLTVGSRPLSFAFDKRWWKHDASWISKHGTTEDREQYLDHLASLEGTLDVQLLDDLGTAYKGHPLGGSGDGQRMRSEFSFAPAVPADAHHLHLVFRKRVFEWNGATVRSTRQESPILSLDVDV